VQIRKQQRNLQGSPKRLPRGGSSTGRSARAITGAVLALALAGGGISIASAANASIASLATSPVRASAKTVLFSGHFHGDAALLINNGAVTISSVTGKGTGTLVGASTIIGKGSSSSAAQCDPFTGTGSITGAAAKLTLHVIETKSQGCSSGESGPVTVTFSGLAVVTGGSGKAGGASGSLKFNGALKLGGTSGSQNGSYTVALKGNLKIKG